ncbi:hypothetical protein CAEBREN_14875 [Caenorhabditis brenneri]|uniref:Uncharacterized protein n=1 Tax=Caenorhabditis brenneri TaxID=135651 RepID=G0MJ47_CAEBE|nr:hypothetical protein CAEBREN_14875 [Caenorhabditis brenneri]
MSESDEKALEIMANNVKASYAWHVEKASTDLKKQLEEKNREIDNLHTFQTAMNPYNRQSSSRAMDKYGQGTSRSMDDRRDPSQQQALGGP